MQYYQVQMQTLKKKKKENWEEKEKIFIIFSHSFYRHISYLRSICLSRFYHFGALSQYYRARTDTGFHPIRSFRFASLMFCTSTIYLGDDGTAYTAQELTPIDRALTCSLERH